jgi:hypothetical protein
MAQGFSGRCLCGAVHYESTADPQLVGQCHCIDCRKTSGTDHGTHLIIPEYAFTITGTLKFYDHPADSGNIVSRGFCPECGAAIYSRNSAMKGVVFVRASSLDDLEIAKPNMIVYASRAPSWSQLDPEVPTYAGMPEKVPSAVTDAIG